MKKVDWKLEVNVQLFVLVVFPLKLTPMFRQAVWNAELGPLFGAVVYGSALAAVSPSTERRWSLVSRPSASVRVVKPSIKSPRQPSVHHPHPSSKGNRRSLGTSGESRTNGEITRRAGKGKEALVLLSPQSWNKSAVWLEEKTPRRILLSPPDWLADWLIFCFPAEDWMMLQPCQTFLKSNPNQGFSLTLTVMLVP